MRSVGAREWLLLVDGLVVAFAIGSALFNRKRTGANAAHYLQYRTVQSFKAKRVTQLADDRSMGIGSAAGQAPLDGRQVTPQLTSGECAYSPGLELRLWDEKSNTSAFLGY